MKKGVDKQHLFLYYMSSSAAVHYRKQNNDAWLSLVERCVRDAEVAGSNPVASTLGRGAGKSKGFPVFCAEKSLVECCVRDAEGSQGPVDLGFEPTEAERRSQVQILSHRLLAGALESRKAFQFFVQKKVW